jgi:homoserine dehydrogenase
MKIALLGCGVVGADVVRLLHAHAADFAARAGAPVELAGIAVRDLDKARDVPAEPALFTTGRRRPGHPG